MRIKHAAILVDGLIFIGHRHHNIFPILDQCGYPVPDFQKYPQGFVTDNGEFVGREEAARIALASGQVSELKFHRTQLFSEDLY